MTLRYSENYYFGFILTFSVENKNVPIKCNRINVGCYKFLILEVPGDYGYQLLNFLRSRPLFLIVRDSLRRI